MAIDCRWEARDGCEELELGRDMEAEGVGTP